MRSKAAGESSSSLRARGLQRNGRLFSQFHGWCSSTYAKM